MNDFSSEIVLGALAGQELNAAERSFLRREQPAGLVLFGRNVSPQLGALIAEAQREGSATRSMIIAIDQEGGRVARIKAPFPNQGPALKLADGSDSPSALLSIKEYASELARALLTYGINVNFAPVLDIYDPEGHGAIGDRAFAATPEAVSRRAHAFLSGMEEAGVWGCLKHFPGQGCARGDTHLESASIPKSLAQLHDWELRPFIDLIPHSSMIMLSHCIYPKLDKLEASMSAVLMQQLLRQELGYKGLILSDDLNMKAILRHRSYEDCVVLAVENGAEMLLVCEGLEKWQLTLDVLRKEGEGSPAFRKKLATAAERVAEFRLRLKAGRASP